MLSTPPKRDLHSRKEKRGTGLLQIGGQEKSTFFYPYSKLNSTPGDILIHCILFLFLNCFGQDVLYPKRKENTLFCNHDRKVQLDRLLGHEAQLARSHHVFGGWQGKSGLGRREETGFVPGDRKQEVTIYVLEFRKSQHIQFCEQEYPLLGSRNEKKKQATLFEIV